MGKISSIKSVSDEKVMVTLELSQQEAVWLKGNLEKMHLFSENDLDQVTKLVLRGKKDSTRYFLVPKEYRQGILASNNIKCTRVETKTKYLFIFAAHKY
ncbi:hypothetical protein H6501_00325 [Candidatus Woesearchaeota archaeon]|nr:hypothetical protein [Nanoarchaeota archaeon]MCB9370027.1 hypothetical protein [Candidatus Woesearchaeota archaeon]USN44560.1 MAG: hypothetical protein H6500_01795 [Candidatus Woesearchaeota archaeon]